MQWIRLLPNPFANATEATSTHAASSPCCTFTHTHTHILPWSDPVPSIRRIVDVIKVFACTMNWRHSHTLRRRRRHALAHTQKQEQQQHTKRPDSGFKSFIIRGRIRGKMCVRMTLGGIFRVFSLDIKVQSLGAGCRIDMDALWRKGITLCD